MKNTSVAIQNLLATSQYKITDLYKITLVSAPGSPLYVTAFDAPLSFGGNTYVTGWTITRGTFKQERGVKTQTVELTVAPQLDSPAVPLVSGSPLLSAIRLSLLDSAAVLWYKAFLDTSQAAPALVDAVLFFQGLVDTAEAGRFQAKLTLASQTVQLTVQMPRNLIQQSCVHTLYDGGCTVNRATFTFTGSVSTNLNTVTNNDITTSMTQADDYFSLGIITFTSGANSGISRTVRRYLNSGGEVQFVNAPPAIIAPGDTFSISAGCDKAMPTCNGRFSNLIHFRGEPFVPTPETLYAGGIGSGSPQNPPLGRQGSLTGGSAVNAYRAPIVYKP